MLFRFPTSYARLTGALLTAAVVFSPSIGLAQTRPFERLEGAWSGSGVIASNDGRSERMRCSAQYSGGGSGLKLQLQCASDSYHFDARSEVVQEFRRRDFWQLERKRQQCGRRRQRASGSRRHRR